MDSQSGNFLKGVTIGTLVGVAVQTGGYLISRGDHTGFGWVMFVIGPFLSGFAVAAVVRGRMRVLASCLMAGITTFSLLLFTGSEGIVCCVMALPLVASGVAIGALVGYLVRGRFVDRMAASGKATAVLLLCCPLLIAAADRIERPFRALQQREVFTTETTLAVSPARTWDVLAQNQMMSGPRPFLLRVGLPVPTRCELDSASVGGQRVCYFDRGFIAQEVTDWQQPSFMGLHITESTLPGRRWLTFIDASYEFVAIGAGTRVVRHTTIGTRLYPRWYWRPLERWGVTSEHTYVFSNLQKWAHSP